MEYKKPKSNVMGNKELELQERLATMAKIQEGKRYASNIVVTLVGQGKMDVDTTDKMITEAIKWEEYFWSDLNQKKSKVIS
jgi:hypothetical protein